MENEIKNIYRNLVWKVMIIYFFIVIYSLFRENRFGFLYGYGMI